MAIGWLWLNLVLALLSSACICLAFLTWEQICCSPGVDDSGGCGRGEEGMIPAACEGGPLARLCLVPGCIASRSFPARCSYRPWWSNRFPLE